LRRPTYVDQTGVDARTASRDLKAMTDLGLLRGVGETKGRHYVAGERLGQVRELVGRSARPVDPYPEMPAQLAALVAGLPVPARGHAASS